MTNKELYHMLGGIHSRKIRQCDGRESDGEGLSSGLEGVSHVDIRKKSFSGMCKDAEAGTNLASLRKGGKQ